MSNSKSSCGCISWLADIYRKIYDLFHEIDAIMTKNAAGKHEETESKNKYRNLLDIAMKNLPLFDDDIKEDTSSVSYRRRYGIYENALRMQYRGQWKKMKS
ncbi:uncharacterized protein [Spinacia oleracea]|uniref:Uncharacterized protein n=1 Tax=Spinacia oleracea TaxID=3562 RepID=A0A9R0IFX9_SPIOL|nr:uncharacterized protein LOC110788221 [Spinacia oleracea]